MRFAGMLPLVLAAAACGQSQTPVGPQSADDAGAATPCESLVRKTTGLYQVAAVDEGLAPNLHADFVQANVHMVMVDCAAQPKTVSACVSGANSVAEIESKCLIPLDDAGEIEGNRFGHEPD